MLVIDILVMCALTSVSPYYDCDNTWEIWLLESEYACGTSYGCIDYNQNFVGHHVIKLSYKHLDYILPDGDTLLQHELKHGICECDNDPWSKYNNIQG